MAERIVQLGGTAKGSTQAVGQRTKLPPYPETSTPSPTT